MHGHFDFHAEEMALMWAQLNEKGFPTFVYGADDLAKVLLGEDWVLLAPKDEYVDYMAGTEKFGRRVGIAFHLWEECAAELQTAAEWMPLDLPITARTQ